MKKFTVAKDQEKIPKELKVLDVVEEKTLTGKCTLKHIIELEGALRNNLDEVREDLKLAERALE